MSKRDEQETGMKKELSLVFPQWQGCALSTQLAEGAKLIASQLPSFDAQATVAVSLQQDLLTQNNIVGYAAILQQLDNARSLLLEHNPSRLLTIGGDCGVDVAPISFLNRCYNQSLSVVWFDAHADSNTPLSSPSGHFHGMPLRTLLGEGDPEIVQRCFSVLRPEQAILVGGRDFDPAEAAFIQSTNLAMVAVEDVLEHGFAPLDAELRLRKADKVYIHLDLDVLDPSEFGYVSYNVPNGFSVQCLADLISRLSNQYSVVGMSVTEFVPEGMKGLEQIQGFIRAGFGQ